MRKIIHILLAALLALPLMAEKPYTLVLDAGHGGKDPGAVGKFSQEKDLNLKLVLAVGKQINEQYPDVNVVYTRSTDVFIPLQKRADIANKANADLFISIHTNSAEKKEPRGVETFILGTDRMEANLDVAMRENAVMKLESDYQTTYQGFDPNSIDSYQAAFWVLLKTACPSILFEMGFISNPEEERFMNEPASIAQMANALVNAFGAYTHKQAVRKEALAIDTTAQAVDMQKHGNDTDSTRNRVVPKTYYAVQICASKTPLAANDPKLQNQPCDTIHAGEWIKYYTAADTDREQVAAKLPALKVLFPDCWIISFKK